MSEHETLEEENKRLRNYKRNAKMSYRALQRAYNEAIRLSQARQVQIQLLTMQVRQCEGTLRRLQEEAYEQERPAKSSVSM